MRDFVQTRAEIARRTIEAKYTINKDKEGIPKFPLNNTPNVSVEEF